MIPPDLLKQLKQIDTPTLSNAIEKLEVRSRVSGFASSRLQALTPELGVMCGYVATATSVTMSQEVKPAPTDYYMDLCERLEQVDGPTVVVIQEVGPHREFACVCGDVMANLFGRFGAVGVVANAAVRDLDGIREVPLRVFATGLVASHGNLHFTDVGCPVTVEGLRLHPGDLVHGDQNGLIVVPQEGAERLPELAKEITEREQRIISTATAGGSISDLSKLRGI